MSTLNWKDQVGITHSFELKTAAQLASTFTRYDSSKTLWVHDGTQVVGAPVFVHTVNPAWESATYNDNHKYSLIINSGADNLKIKNPTLKPNLLLSVNRSGDDYPDVGAWSWSKTWKAEDLIYSEYDANFVISGYQTGGPSTDAGVVQLKVDGVVIFTGSTFVSPKSWGISLSGYHTVQVSLGVRGTNGDNKWHFDIYSTET